MQAEDFACGRTACGGTESQVELRYELNMRIKMTISVFGWSFVNYCKEVCKEV